MLILYFFILYFIYRTIKIIYFLYNFYKLIIFLYNFEIVYNIYIIHHYFNNKFINYDLISNYSQILIKIFYLLFSAVYP